MKKVLIIIIVISSTLLLFHYGVNAATDNGQSKFKDNAQELSDIGLSIKSKNHFQKEKETFPKFVSLNNIYSAGTSSEDAFKSNELKVMAFHLKDNKDSETLLKEFIDRYVTTEFKYEISNLPTNDSREIAFTSFSIFNDGQLSSVENYAVIKNKNRYVVAILGYLKPYKGENQYQEDFWKSSLLDINFTTKYNEKDINNF